MEWCDPSQSPGNIVVQNETSLASLDATRYLPGAVRVYVQTYEADFTLVAVPPNTPAFLGMSVNALNLTNYQWVRCLESRAWWQQINWLWDPANSTGVASDENDGLVLPVKTCDEIQRRLFGRYDTAGNQQNITITLLSDCSDSDQLFMNLGSDLVQGKMTVALNGTVRPIPVGTITSVTRLNAPTTNSASLIVVPGFNFSPYIGNNLHLVGTSGTTSTVAVIEAAPSLGTVQVSERYSGLPDTDAGFIVGNVVEIALLTKLSGISVKGANVFVQDCNLNKTSGAIDLIVDPMVGSLTLTRCELRGNTTPGVTSNIYGKQIGLYGCSMVNSSWIFNNGAAFNSVGGAAINCARITVGSCDLRHHVADFGLINSMLYGYDYASIRLHGNLHCYNLQAHAVGLALRYGAQAYISGSYYGTGNDPTSAGVCMTGNTRFYLQGATPTMDAGLGLVIDSNDEPTVANNGGTSVAFAAVPYPAAAGTLTPRFSAYAAG